MWLKWRLPEREIEDTTLRISCEGLEGHAKSVLGRHFLCVQRHVGKRRKGGLNKTGSEAESSRVDAAIFQMENKDDKLKKINNLKEDKEHL